MHCNIQFFSSRQEDEGEEYVCGPTISCSFVSGDGCQWGEYKITATFEALASSLPSFRHRINRQYSLPESRTQMQWRLRSMS
jgi:hypothetical protein